MGSGTGERVSKSGTGWEASGQIVVREENGTGTVHLAVGRERGNINQKRERSGNIGRERKYRDRSRSRTVPTFTARSPGILYLVYNLPPSLIRNRSTVSTVSIFFPINNCSH